VSEHSPTCAYLVRHGECSGTCMQSVRTRMVAAGEEALHKYWRLDDDHEDIAGYVVDAVMRLLAEERA
jgi:hypothetical protein